MAAQVLEAHQALAAEKPGDPGLRPPTARRPDEADAGELEIIFNNLVSNAIKYNQDSGSVTVKVEEDPDEVTIAVTDTGIGMTAEEMAKLFGEFSRIRNEKTRNILGSGLGLSILRRLAGLYGGDGEGAERAGGGQHVHRDAEEIRPARHPCRVVQCWPGGAGRLLPLRSR